MNEDELRQRLANVEQRVILLDKKVTEVAHAVSSVLAALAEMRSGRRR